MFDGAATVERTLDGGVRGDDDGGAGVGVGDLDADGGDGGDDAEDARNYWTFSCQKLLDFLDARNYWTFLMPETTGLS